MGIFRDSLEKVREKKEELGNESGSKGKPLSGSVFEIWKNIGKTDVKGMEMITANPFCGMMNTKNLRYNKQRESIYSHSLVGALPPNPP